MDHYEPDRSPPPGYGDDVYTETVQPPPGYFTNDLNGPRFPEHRVFDGEYGSYNDYPKGEKDHLLAGLSHIIPPLGLGILVFRKEMSPYLRFHALQGAIFGFSAYLLAFFFAAFLTFLCLSWLPLLLVIIITSVAAIQCWMGNDFRYPVLASIIERKFI